MRILLLLLITACAHEQLPDELDRNEVPYRQEYRYDVPPPRNGD